ncbi:hypothetical protein PVAP13_9KG290300 [Panicum virgatum]|uniref:VWFA domain-containing protein n=1 Tax=Panicum virgatum TaxID=38727 RepID=A0A8T0NPA7_PANVG|nr:hypothetical protein PVAP13_9KG290300 [Panicum virgatum]
MASSVVTFPCRSMENRQPAAGCGWAFYDDEPLEPRQIAGGAAANGGLVLKAQCEFPALGTGASRDRFAVLVDAKAPAGAPRAPLDLVLVLDVSGSMKGPKLALLKQAVCFVVDQLGPADRLSVLTFSDVARRLTRLARMSGAGKAAAKRAVEARAAEGGTNIAAGLRAGAEVLVGRRRDPPVRRPRLGPPATHRRRRQELHEPRPPAFVHAASRPVPIHTFGLGTDHDAAAMHAIAEATGGTFSFVQDQAAIQDSFARCVGGLLSVAVQEARIAVACLHRGVRVQEVKSGSYGSHVAADGRAASIDAGELYDDERRRFLVLVYVPRARATEEVTRLVKGPLELTDMPAPSMEAERERVRLAAAEGIAAARVAADGGQHAGAARILNARLREVERSAPGAAGDDPTCEAIKEELRDLSERVGDRREYQQSGRASLLAGMSSHAQQLASGVELMQSSAGKTPRAYLTPKMEEMVDLSRESSSSRKRGSSERPGGGSRLDKQIKQDLSEN